MRAATLNKDTKVFDFVATDGAECDGASLIKNVSLKTQIIEIVRDDVDDNDDDIAFNDDVNDIDINDDVDDIDIDIDDGDDASEETNIC